MSIAEKKDYCRILGNHLRYINNLLHDSGLIRDMTPIQSAATMYQRSLDLDSNNFEAIIEQLKFYNIDSDQKFRKIRPMGVDRDAGLELDFSIKLKANIPLLKIADPLSELNIGLKLTAFDANAEYVVNSWHIDRHIFKEGEVSYFPHPIYHIQYGGRTMTDDNTLTYGTTLLVDTPRIPCPPFDIALSIDYILSNYYGKQWYIFKEDCRYNEAIKFSQKYFWYSYYKSTLDALESTCIINENFLYMLINPQLT